MSKTHQLIQRIAQFTVLPGILVLVLLISSPMSTSASTPNVSSQQVHQRIETPNSPGNYAYYLLQLINQDRAQRGLNPYRMDNKLWAVAYAHNIRMAGGCGLTHQCPGEPDSGTRISQGGFPNRAWGENCGYHPGITKDIVQKIEKSMVDEGPSGGHYQTLFNRTYVLAGISVTFDKNNTTMWVTEDFVSNG